MSADGPAGSVERSVPLGDGASTTLETWGDAGPLVLCVHGIGSSRRNWTRLGERLAGTHRVAAYDQRGHGDSAAVEGPMTLERSVADLRAVLAALGEPIACLVGHSWGGAVAVKAGRELADVPRVLAVDPMLRVAPGTFAGDYVDDVREMLALPPGPRERAIREAYAGAEPVDVAAKLHALLPMTIRPLERLGAENGADAGGWDLTGSLAAYPVPLLVLAAGVESVLSAADLDALRAAAPAVRTEVVEGHGHVLQRTAFDRFAREVAAFAPAA